jgi:hypothetical protein
MDARYPVAVQGLLILILCLSITVISVPSPLSAADQANPSPESPAKKPQAAFQAGKDTGIQHVVPKKPVRLKLHRNAKGEYSWDLTGDSVEDVVKADRRLRKLLDIE